MKLDKINFAKVIAFIIEANRSGFDDDAIETLDRMIDIDVQPVALPINLSAVDGLMQCMAEGKQKLEAIRYYRSLTGMGLKESKDFVEKYWHTRYSVADLSQKLTDTKLKDDAEHYAISRFIDSLN